MSLLSKASCVPRVPSVLPMEVSRRGQNRRLPRTSAREKSLVTKRMKIVLDGAERNKATEKITETNPKLGRRRASPKRLPSNTSLMKKSCVKPGWRHQPSTKLEWAPSSMRLVRLPAKSRPYPPCHGHRLRTRCAFPKSVITFVSW